MVATKTPPIDKQKAMQLVNSFFDRFKQACEKKQSPTASDFEGILSRDFQNSINGKVVGKNIEDFIKRTLEIQKKYSHIDLAHVHDCLISDNKVIIQYDIGLTSHNKEKRLLNIMAIATIDDHLISHWSQVSHDKGKDHLHS